MIDVFDSQMKIYFDRLHPWLQSISKTYGNLEDTRLRIIDRFRDEMNVEVDVKCWETDVPGCIAFDVEIQRNLLPWDPDQQVHEAVKNVLELPGEGGVIKVDKGQVDALRDGDVKAAHGLHIPGH